MTEAQAQPRRCTIEKTLIRQTKQQEDPDHATHIPEFDDHVWLPDPVRGPGLGPRARRWRRRGWGGRRGGGRGSTWGGGGGRGRSARGRRGGGGGGGRAPRGRGGG